MSSYNRVEGMQDLLKSEILMKSVVNPNVSMDASSCAPSENDSRLGVQDMFGEDVNVKGKPVKGYRFLIFTFLMIVLLTTITVYNVEEIREQGKQIDE